MNDLRQYFFSLFERLAEIVRSDECLILNFLGEQSDFVRLNGRKVRQAGQVTQFELAIHLICEERGAKAMIQVSGALEVDRELAAQVIAMLRDQIVSLPADPYLSINRATRNSESVGGDKPQPANQTVTEILKASESMDLVGMLASGQLHRGFANSFGQRNWYTKHSFHFDWSCFLHDHRAVKSRYAGFVWDRTEFERNLLKVRGALEILSRPEAKIAPGRHRVFLAPCAVEELLSIVAWEGFGAKALHTQQSSLLKLARGIESLNPAVSLVENNSGGLAPDFTRTGFIKPAQVDLIREGKHAGVLVNSRSAKEYGLTVNADSEYPVSLDMAAGALEDHVILKALDRGLYIGNLWYCNYSDLNDCRITGMTRYACFWVEHGQIVAPLGPMRFDESLYRMFGANLLAITREREWIPSSDTYLRRSLSSMCVPGVLIDDFNFTL